MINNYDKILPFLQFDSQDDYYFCQVLKRKKEHPELGSNSYTVKTYYIKSIEDLNFHFDEIKCLCEFHNARAYINLNKRSFKKTAFHTLKKITDIILAEDYKSVRGAYNSVCGTYSNDPNKKWIIDIDDVDPNNTAYFQPMIDYINNIEPIGDKIYTILPTKSGVHLITKPFNLQKFREVYAVTDVHKENPVNLYIP